MKIDLVLISQHDMDDEKEKVTDLEILIQVDQVTLEKMIFIGNQMIHIQANTEAVLLINEMIQEDDKEVQLEKVEEEINKIKKSPKFLGDFFILFINYTLSSILISSLYLATLSVLDREPVLINQVFFATTR